MGLRFDDLIFTVRPQKKIISCFTSFSWKFDAESKSEKRFFKLILRVRAKNINKLKTGNFYRYLAITSLDFNS